MSPKKQLYNHQRRWFGHVQAILFARLCLLTSEVAEQDYGDPNQKSKQGKVISY